MKSRLKRLSLILLVVALMLFVMVMTGCGNMASYVGGASQETEEALETEETMEAEDVEAVDMLEDEQLVLEDKDEEALQPDSEAQDEEPDTVDDEWEDEEAVEEESSDDESLDEDAEQPDENVMTYVLNTNTHKFHYPTCNSVNQMKDKNKEVVDATREDVISWGYDPCGNCHP